MALLRTGCDDMVNFHDRRAEKEAREAIDQRADGSIRRPGKGGRTVADFFGADHTQRNLSRADYLNLRASEEFARREGTWYRRIVRFLLGDPQVRDVNWAMADAHARTLEALKQAMQEKEKTP